MLVFDPSESEDASSFEQIRSANRNSRAVEWVELVEYDGVGVVLDAARPPQHLRRDHPNTPKRRKLCLSRKCLVKRRKWGVKRGKVIW